MYPVCLYCRAAVQKATLLAIAAAVGSVWICDAQSTRQTIVLENSSNFKVEFTPIGATIQKLLVPQCKDRSKTVDVALGYDDVTAYARNPHPSFGATVGRVGNRISGAQFTLDGKTYKLAANEGNNTIHGGAVKWSQQLWTPVKGANGRSVTFSYTSKDGEAGFPGTVKTAVTYSIPEKGTYLNISISATTDKATPLNIINHNYFNLKGAGNGDILDHVVKIPAQYYTAAVPKVLLPTGQIFKVKGTPYDLTSPTPIRKSYLNADGGPYKGYDLNYVIPEPYSSPEPVWWKPGQNPQTAAAAATAPLKLAAVVMEPTTGLKLRVYTNTPGIQFYSGNFLAASASEYAAPGKGGVLYPQYGGFCLEAQAFPNAINVATFPSMVVRPGETFSNRVSYDFLCL